MKLGYVVWLQTSAIKGFGVSSAPDLMIRSYGADGDRDLFIVDADDRLFSATRSGAFLRYRAVWNAAERHLSIVCDNNVVVSAPVVPASPLVAHFYADRQCSGQLVAGPFDDWLSATADRRLRLVLADDPGGGVDIEPITLVSRSTLRAIDVPEDTDAASARRFRLNLTVEAAGDGPYVEEEWAGETVSIGEAVLRLGGRVPRCAAVQRNPNTGGKGTQVLKRIFERRGRGPTGSLDLGVYAEVLKEGRIAVGDALVSTS